MIIAGSPRPTPLPEKLSSRTRNTLARSGITTVEEVMDAYPIRLLKLPGFGIEWLGVYDDCFAGTSVSVAMMRVTHGD